LKCRFTSGLQDEVEAMVVLNKEFKARLQKSPKKGGWTYVVWPKSAEFFGTKGLVKVSCTVDDHPLRTAFMAMGGGVHKLPIKEDVRAAIGKKAGDAVIIRLLERR
jgi:hypothetical protein